MIVSFTATAFGQTKLDQGDNCFNKGDYKCAKIVYQEVMNTATGRDKQIAEIKLSRAKSCNDWLTAANSAFNSGDYQVAKDNYQFVLNENSNDAYAKAQIVKCDKGIEDAITLSVTKDSLTLDSFGGSERIYVDTNAETYSISQLPTWCRVQKYDRYFDISFDANTSETARMGGFKVTAGQKEVNGSLMQAPQPKIETTLSVKKEFILIEANEKIVFIDVYTNSSDFDITELPKWCKVKNKYDAWFSMECDENVSHISRFGDLIITAGDKKVTIRLEQRGAQKSEKIKKSKSSTKIAKYRPSTSRYKYFAIGYEGGEIAEYGFRMEFGGLKFVGMFLNVRSTLISDEELFRSSGYLENKNEAIIGLNFRISRVIYFNLGGGYGYYKIPGINESLNQVEYFPAYGGLTFRLGRRINFSVGASFIDIEQAIEYSNFDAEFTLGLTINVLK